MTIIPSSASLSFPTTQQWITQGEDATAALAPVIYGTYRAYPCLTLSGTLGAGKSVFARALIRHLSQQPDLIVPSPTFTLVQTYDTPMGMLWHFDLYRLDDHQAVYELGWEEAMTSPLTLVEWPQRLGPLLPAKRVDLTFDTDSTLPDQRIIKAVAHG